MLSILGHKYDKIRVFQKIKVSFLSHTVRPKLVLKTPLGVVSLQVNIRGIEPP